ncbi:recombinase family protein, partial [Borreliella garinii]|uniref:recombinase family protein n=1 Tax=Borreliella garinii TaxID=29519 RepID=UPI001AEFB9A6
MVQDIFDWCCNGMGNESIARRLNEGNVPTFGSRSKNLWHTSYIQKILNNRSVLGEFQPHIML